MNWIAVNKSHIGKRLVFRSVTRWNTREATRVIKNVNDDGSVEVRFGGHPNFRVRPHEVRMVK